MKSLCLLLGSLMISGCGTFNTLSKSDSEIALSLQQANTLCTQLPRAYSGAMYNLCVLHSDQDSVHIDWFLGFYALDTIPSAALDTVLLPFTLFSQSRRGSIPVTQPCENTVPSGPYGADPELLSSTNCLPETPAELDLQT